MNDYKLMLIYISAQITKLDNTFLLTQEY